MKLIIENRAFEMKSEKRRALNILESIELKDLSEAKTREGGKKDEKIYKIKDKRRQV